MIIVMYYVIMSISSVDIKRSRPEDWTLIHFDNNNVVHYYEYFFDTKTS